MRRGELKLMENVIAFLMIMILGMIAFIYFAVAQGSAQKVANQQHADLEAVRTAQALYDMPELACTFSSFGRCIDLGKARALATYLEANPENQSVYLPLFGRSAVSVDCVRCKTPITIYDQLPKGSGYRAIQVPVAVYNQTTGFTSFGYLEVKR